MNTTSKLAIPLAIATALTACAVLFTDATAAPPASPTTSPLKGDLSVTIGADNFYKSDKVTVEKVTFKNQYRMTVAATSSSRRIGLKTQSSPPWSSGTRWAR